MIQIAAWLGTLWGRVALGAGVVVALVGLRAWDVSTQQAKGAAKATAKIEKATNNATSRGKAASDLAGKPRAPGVHAVVGKRDPSTIND